MYVCTSIERCRFEKSIKLQSPFSVFNFYSNVLSRIIFNYCNNILSSVLLPGLKDRNYTTCRCWDCLTLKENKIRAVIFKHAAKLSKRLVIQSCQVINADYIRNVLYSYKYGVDFFSQSMTILPLKNKTDHAD